MNKVRLIGQDCLMNCNEKILISAGSTYLDIDAYACMVAMEELLRLQGNEAIAYSRAPRNYSVCQSLIGDTKIHDCIPSERLLTQAQYIIVDVSDPKYLDKMVPVNLICAIYDHHHGFEEYWQERLGDNAHIEFIGAAATLVYREWENAGLTPRMSSATARLLIAAILDNTLNLSSKNTTVEDRTVFRTLCEKERIGGKWCSAYFGEVQENIEADLMNALLGDMKQIEQNCFLPSHIGQLAVWDPTSILRRLPEIRACFHTRFDEWMLNIIDIQHRFCWFICDDMDYQKSLSAIFHVEFEAGIAKTDRPYLRKEILKRARTAEQSFCSPQ